MMIADLSDLPASLSTDEISATPLLIVDKDDYQSWFAQASENDKSWLAAHGWDETPGEIISLPGNKGGLARILCVAEKKDLSFFAKVANGIAPGHYYFETDLGDGLGLAALGWALGQYRFTRYKKDDGKTRVLILKDVDQARHIAVQVNTTYLARDLINTPTNDMGPSALAGCAQSFAELHGANIKITVGENLLRENFPAIHAVGRAAADAPRLIDLRWGDENHPKVTLVGKGVCFDTGGLDIKPGSGMRLMKKDMGGAAHALALAAQIMEEKLPIRLRLLIPAVENSISGNAYRPSDIIETRKGLSVEVGNTDAEGRIVLCDALTLADEEAPELLIDFATLTGAARVALGPDLPAMFTNDDALASALASTGLEIEDPMWRMPLWQPYNETLQSPIADLSNISDGPFAGAITAALYLEHFVEQAKSWVHFDVFGWNATNRPHRPKGGEAMALRSVFAYLEQRFQVKKDEETS